MLIAWQLPGNPVSAAPCHATDGRGKRAELDIVITQSSSHPRNVLDSIISHWPRIMDDLCARRAFEIGEMISKKIAFNATLESTPALWTRDGPSSRRFDSGPFFSSSDRFYFPVGLESFAVSLRTVIFRRIFLFFTFSDRVACTPNSKTTETIISNYFERKPYPVRIFFH